MAKVEIYTNSATSFLKVKKDQQSLKYLLDRKKVAYIEYDFVSDEASQTRMRQVSGKTALPQVMVNGVFIGTYDDVLALDEIGELDAKLLG